VAGHVYRLARLRHGLFQARTGCLAIILQAGIGQVAALRLKGSILDVRTVISVVNPPGIKGTDATIDAVHHVAFIQREFRKGQPILTVDAGYQ
jgi:hypothetical protein